MRTKTFEATLFDSDHNDYDAIITAEYHPAERGNRDYPGCPAHITSFDVEFEDGVERPELLKSIEENIEELCMEQFEEKGDGGR